MELGFDEGIELGLELGLLLRLGIELGAVVAVILLEDYDKHKQISKSKKQIFQQPEEPSETDHKNSLMSALFLGSTEVIDNGNRGSIQRRGRDKKNKRQKKNICEETPNKIFQ